MRRLILTEEEDKFLKYCEDFCPIYSAIEQFNRRNKHNIYCRTEMCEAVKEAYIPNKRDNS